VPSWKAFVALDATWQHIYSHLDSKMM